MDKQEVAEPEAQERDALEHGMQIQRAGSPSQMQAQETETLKERHVLQAQRRGTQVA